MDIVKISDDSCLEVEITVTDVNFLCRIRGNVTRASATFRLTTLYRSGSSYAVEYRSLAEWARSLAASRSWTAEELAESLASRMAQELAEKGFAACSPDGYLIVELTFEEPGVGPVRVKKVRRLER
ncbi:MAG: hypothetical protein ABWW70_04010 [Thermoproteota archaeon]